MEKVPGNEALSVMLRRKSVRHFTGEKVPPEMIREILKVAMAAPAAVHMLPWHFIVITENDTLKVLSDGLPFAKMLIHAGTGIVVCAVPAEAALCNKEFAVIDCTCASENILLAAEAYGLGAVWTAVYPDERLMKFVRSQLDIPDYVIPLNVIPVGYPAGIEKAEDRFNPKRIHMAKW